MTNIIIKIENSSNYGIINDNLINYDEQKLLGEYLLNFKLKRIRCWSEKNVGLSGMQILYKNRITSQEVKTIDVIKKDFSGEEQEITLDSNEMINKVILWKDEALRGFEIKTNKGREKKFGWCGEGTKEEFEKFVNHYLIGFFLGFHKKEGILSMGFYFVKEEDYYLLLYLGIFMLRIKLKKKDFKNKIMEKLPTMDISDKALFHTCSLPNNQFFGIFKYIFG